MTTETQIEAQIERENKYKALAEEAYAIRQATANSSGLARNTFAGNRLNQSEASVRPVAEAIERMVQDFEEGTATAGRPPRAVHYLRQMQAWPAAILAVRIALDGAVQGAPMGTTAMRLSRALFDHYQFDQLEGEAMGLVVYMEKKHKRRPAGAQKASIMRHACKMANIPPMEWSEGDRLKVGSTLIELVVKTTGLIEMQHVRKGYTQSSQQLCLSPATSEWYAQLDAAAINLFANDMRPTLIPPKPWTSAVNGGYYSNSHTRDVMRKTFSESRDDLLSHDIQPVLDAINLVQETPWRINKAVFDIMSAAYERGDTIGDLPKRDHDPIPERPPGIAEGVRMADLPEREQELIAEWRRAATKVHMDNHARSSQIVALKQQLNAATDLAQEERFWFPHNMDFRGRLYPLPPTLNPQSDDFGKSMLEFANGKPLGENGAYWLAVHIANLFGVDKVSFDERVEWVMDHTAQILDSAASPLDGGRFWTEADDPWCALAACFEWAGYHAMRDDYVSHLPIAMDGSCSGLQHFSAMLRDEEGGAAVNLTPTEQPSDIYTEVMERVISYIEAPKGGGDLQLAKAWQGKVTRKIVKRPCMTFAYSVTRRGIVVQVTDELRKAYGENALPGYDNAEAASFLAPLIEQAIRETVSRAAEAMDYLKGVCALVNVADRPLVWYTPDGLPVLQLKRKYTSKKHKVWFLGERVRLTLRVDTKHINKPKQKTSVAPNFVHSMDACHLRLVVRRLAELGITDFSMIHDSFGVHACDLDVLNHVIREEFIDMYQHDVLAEFREQAQANLPLDTEVPEPPSRGTLDLEGVRAADFFFS